MVAAGVHGTGEGRALTPDVYIVRLPVFCRRHAATIGEDDMAKLGVLVGFGAGYVLGARAGRQRYDQLVGRAQELWRDPRVQRKAARAHDVVQEKASQAAGAVQGTVKDRVPGLGRDDSDKSDGTRGTGSVGGVGGVGASGSVATPPTPAR
jgi:hypothetical protein